jgi:hypothetical protein
MAVRRSRGLCAGELIFRTSPCLLSRFVCPLVGFALALLPVVAIAQQAQVPAVDSRADELAQDQRPAPEGDVLAPKSLFQLYFAVRTAPGSGLDDAIRTVTTDTFKLRADTRIDLTTDWQLSLRGDLPFVAKDPLNSSNPSGDYLYGVADADLQAALIHDIDARWKAAFGARLIMPTGVDNLGSGKWQIMPIVGMRYSMPDVGSGLYFEPLLRYDASFAGDPSKKSITICSLPQWSISLSPKAGSSRSIRSPTFAGISVRLSPARPGVSFCPSTPALGENSPKS